MVVMRVNIFLMLFINSFRTSINLENMNLIAFEIDLRKLQIDLYRGVATVTKTFLTFLVIFNITLPTFFATFTITFNIVSPTSMNKENGMKAGAC
jgi:hypothetical protein